MDTSRRQLELDAAGLAPAAPEVRALESEEQRVLGLRMELTRLEDERARMVASLGSPLAPAGPHAHLRHRRTPLQPVSGARNRALSWWAVVSAPVVLYAIGQIVLPTVGVSASVIAVVWLVLLLSIEGLVRGKFLAVMARMAMVTLVIIGLYYFVVDWRIVFGWTFVAAAALLFLVNVRDAIRR